MINCEQPYDPISHPPGEMAAEAKAKISQLQAEIERLKLIIVYQNVEIRRLALFDR